MKILLFHAHKGDLLSFAIKALTRSPYCHAAILIDTPKWQAEVAKQFVLPNKGHVIIEAYFPKVRARELQDDELAEIDVFSVPSHTPDKEDLSMQWLIQQVANGTKYDITDLFRFLPEARAVMGEATDNSFQQHTFCSMLADNGFRMGGTRLFTPYLHDFNTAPETLAWSILTVPELKLQPLT